MKLAVIVGSTREGRKTINQAKWVVNTAKEIPAIQAHLIDLKDYDLPFFDEPISPRYNPNRQIDPSAKKWLDTVAGYDAYVFVTPEYNHSVPAVLKNAIDYITSELQRKPVAVVSHGAQGGVRAATDLKEILSESRAVPIPNFVALNGMSEVIDEAGTLDVEVKKRPYGPQQSLTNLLDELKWYSDALANARVGNKELVLA